MTYAESNFAGSAIAANNQAAFTFSYLDVSEIRVDITVGSTTTTYSTSSSPAGFTVVSPNQFVTLSSHPADTDAIRIYRVTNLDTTQATFVSGSAISANDLNNNYKQTLQAAQEARLESSQATSTADTAKTTADARPLLLAMPLLQQISRYNGQRGCYYIMLRVQRLQLLTIRLRIRLILLRCTSMTVQILRDLVLEVTRKVLLMQLTPLTVPLQHRRMQLIQLIQPTQMQQKH